ncbi:MAG: N-acetylmuramoyl-L-alanine amidase, partial [Fimbriimonadales bacterium]|nr:N-acetylmuramoyl-L-alanine amidase [Fimbriimonadales bacterium]
MEGRARRIAVGLILTLALSLSWADGLREATVLLRGERLTLNPPALWDGRELWLPVQHLAQMGLPVALEGNAVRLTAIPPDQPESRLLAEPKRGVDCAPLRDLIRRLGGFTRWDEATATLSLLARLREARLENDALHGSASLPIAWRAFALQNPSRLVIDLAGCALPETPIPLPEPSGAVKAVRVGQFDPHTVRIVLEMDAPHAAPETGVQAEWRIALTPNAPVAAEPTDAPAPPNAIEVVQPPEPTPEPFQMPTLQRNAQGTVQLRIPHPEGVRPRVLFLENPMRIAIDVPGYLQEAVEQTVEDPSMFVRALRAAPIEGGMVRLVLELSRSVGAQILSGKAGVTLNLRAPRNTGGKLSEKVIVIDPGHGGAQPGARWREGDKVIEEKTIVLAIGLHIAELLSREGAKVILTRSEDKAIGLYERTNLSNNAGAHFFISLHCDSNPRPNSASGTTIYYHKDDADSRALGQAIL